MSIDRPRAAAFALFVLAGLAFSWGVQAMEGDVNGLVTRGGSGSGAREAVLRFQNTGAEALTVEVAFLRPGGEVAQLEIFPLGGRSTVDREVATLEPGSYAARVAWSYSSGGSSAQHTRTFSFDNRVCDASEQVVMHLSAAYRRGTGITSTWRQACEPV